MATELKIQRDIMLRFITERVGGLGYREVSANTISNQLIVHQDLWEWLQKPLNAQTTKLVVRQHFGGDDKAFLQAFAQELHDNAFRSANVAIFLRSPFNFKDHSFTMFATSGSVINGDDSFDDNIFSVCEELTYKPQEFTDSQGKQHDRRVDLAFFVNGLFFSYCELKHITKGQKASEEGRKKVASNYIEALKLFCLPHTALTPNATLDWKRQSFLKLFEKAIHVTTTDLGETYVMRGIQQHAKAIEQSFQEGALSNKHLIDAILKDFKRYPCEPDGLSPQQAMQQTFRNLYGKHAIENEILYYNFLKYSLKDEGGRKVRTGNTGIQIAPRPKQKFGTDKTIARIETLYRHEQDPTFLEQEFTALLATLPDDQIRVELEARRALLNNRNLFSILLQYSAGFGKTNIMCWLALRLKDLMKDGQYLFDKVLLVSDRVGLRDQVFDTMFNMNIDKRLYEEATDSSFHQLLLDTRLRIVIINIQKFNFINNKLSRADKKLLSQMRTAFIIDEIHRSNSGEQNQRMTTLFDELADKLTQDIEGANKNALIGLTATPSQSVLKRFGEPSGLGSDGLVWRPFDAYSMKEAIEDGYVLDTKGSIISVSPSKHLLEPKGNPADYKMPSKQEIYEHQDRIKINARYIVEVLLNNTYRKLNGYGKAMLACYSIDAAILYVDALRRYYAQATAAEGSHYENAQIYIVYSNSSKQHHPKSSTLNHNMSEEQVVRKFKNKRNGLMVVVDKLQTGFDEPRLHTLFLDKEIAGITAVQTVSRVNRTAPNKDSCLVVDLSDDGVNAESIRKAFAEYEGLVSTAFNHQHHADRVRQLLNAVKSDPIVESSFDLYLRSLSDTQADMELIHQVSQMDEEALKATLRKGSELSAAVDQAYGVIYLPKGSTDGRWNHFFRTLRNLLVAHRPGIDKQSVDFYFVDNIGPWEQSEIDPAPATAGTSTSKGASAATPEVASTELDLINRILAENKQELLKEEALEAFNAKVSMLFDDILKYDQSTKGGQLKALIQAGKSNDAELYDIFKVLLRKTWRKADQDPNRYPSLFREPFEMLKEHYFARFKARLGATTTG